MSVRGHLDGLPPIRILVREEQSEGRVGVVESTMPAGAPGPPLHLHDFDEAFYVLEGERRRSSSATS